MRMNFMLTSWTFSIIMNCINNRITSYFTSINNFSSSRTIRTTIIRHTKIVFISSTLRTFVLRLTPVEDGADLVSPHLYLLVSALGTSQPLLSYTLRPSSIRQHLLLAILLMTVSFIFLSTLRRTLSSFIASTHQAGTLGIQSLLSGLKSLSSLPIICSIVIVFIICHNISFYI